MNFEECQASCVPDVIGIIGVSCVLAAYVLLQMRYWDAKDYSFSAVNLIGSLLILFSLFFHWNLPSVVIEIVWIAISVYGLWKALWKQS